MKKLLGITSLIMALGLIFAFNNPPALENDGYKVGDVAEDFSLKNIDGNYLSLKDIPNVNGYIVIFTCFKI